MIVLHCTLHNSTTYVISNFEFYSIFYITSFLRMCTSNTFIRCQNYFLVPFFPWLLIHMHYYSRYDLIFNFSKFSTFFRTFISSHYVTFFRFCATVQLSFENRQTCHPVFLLNEWEFCKNYIFCKFEIIITNCLKTPNSSVMFIPWYILPH